VLGRKLVKSNFTGDTKVALTLTVSRTQAWHGDPNNRFLWRVGAQQDHRGAWFDLQG
jgi:hypothetical protein